MIGIVLGVIWDQSFPINKPLWTSSYVVYTAGIATLMLSAFLWVIDVKGKKKWALPLVMFGMNPLFIYALSILFVKTMFRIKWQADGETVNLYQWIYEQVFASWAGDLNGSLFFALSYVLLHLCIAWILYRRKIFVKV